MVYKNKPLEVWFYGSRTNFFFEQTRKASQEAFDSCGTNAGPFLLSKLKKAQGNGPQYFKLFRSLPVWAQSKLPYPISGDDIIAIALEHIRKTRSITDEQVEALAHRVAGFQNPRLRMLGLHVMQMNHQTHHVFSSLCRNLLNDEHPGLRLEAAIWLGDSAIVSNPNEPRLFAILIAGLENKENRIARLDVSGYRFQQQPPGGSGRPASFAVSPHSLRVEQQDQYLKDRIETALARLRPYLDQAEKDRLRIANQSEGE